MAITVNHSTPADGSFSATGATAWNAAHTLSGLGTMAEQNANAVAITGGSISVPTLIATTNEIVGNVGTSGSTIVFNGNTYDSNLKVSDIGDARIAQTILSKNSTNVPPVLITARSNSDTSTNASVVNDMDLFDIIATGYAGSDYKQFAGISFQSDITGTISNTSAPGRIALSVTPDGTLIPRETLIIKADRSVELTNNVRIGGDLQINGGLTANPNNQNISFTPTGTGTIDINPATTGTINNMAIGGTTPKAGAFTSLSATSGIGGGAF